MGRQMVDQLTIVKGCTVYEGKDGKFNPIPVCIDSAEVGLPAIAHPTIESQSMGPIECVDQTRVNALQLTITCEPSIEQSRLHGYGTKDYMIKWGQEYKKADGTGFALAPFVAYVKGTPVDESGSNVNPGNNTTGTVTVNATYYRLVQNGKVIRYIDKLKGILEINGVDYRAELEKML
jgi:phage tail tube protein FII